MAPSTFDFNSDYERMTGGCTRRIAEHIASTITPPITASSLILDNACGPGIVSAAIKTLHPDARIKASDISQKMIDMTMQRIKDEHWNNIDTEILDTCNLSTLRDGTFSHVITNLSMPLPGDENSGPRIVPEAFRVLKNEGVAVFSTWADRVWPIAFLNTARQVRPHETPSEGVAMPPCIMNGSWLFGQLERAGFGVNVEVRPFITYTSAESMDSLVENFMLAKQMFFSGYSELELGRAASILKDELQKVRTFETLEGGVRIGMKAWIGMGWKHLMGLRNYTESVDLRIA